MSEIDRPLVEMRNILKIFGEGTPDETVLFDHFDLSIRRGEFVSVVGSNGSGKTTMLNILCGSLPFEGGGVYLDGRDLKKLKEHQRASFIGRVFQDPSRGTCADLTVLENLALADNKGKPYNLRWGVDRRRVEGYRAMLEPLGLGLENRMNQLVGSMSGGQRQALALLLCTMTPIELLILDEHTAALDPRAADTVMGLTEQLVKDKGLTTLMVTHNLKYAVNYGNRLLMMHQGRSVIDAGGEERGRYSVDELLDTFNQISIEVGN